MAKEYSSDLWDGLTYLGIVILPALILALCVETPLRHRHNPVESYWSWNDLYIEPATYSPTEGESYTEEEFYNAIAETILNSAKTKRRALIAYGCVPPWLVGEILFFIHGMDGFDFDIYIRRYYTITDEYGINHKVQEDHLLDKRLSYFEIGRYKSLDSFNANHAITHKIKNLLYQIEQTPPFSPNQAPSL